MISLLQLSLVLMLLSPLAAYAGEMMSGETLRQKLDAIFAEANDTEKLLHLALAPPNSDTDTNLDNNVKARAYSLLAKQAEQPGEAAKIRPFAHAFLTVYDKPSSSDWMRAHLARLLLHFETVQHRHAEFVLELLKQSDLAQPYPKWRQAREDEALKLLVRLNGLQKPDASQVVYGLAPLFHQSFSHSLRVIDAALDVVDSYKMQRSSSETDALVQAYGKLQQVWQQQKASEAQSASSLTVWDNASEADVSATLRKFTASICVAGNARPKVYVYVPHGDQMYATGKPVSINCAQGQEAK